MFDDPDNLVALWFPVFYESRIRKRIIVAFQPAQPSASALTLK